MRCLLKKRKEKYEQDYFILFERKDRQINNNMKWNEIDDSVE